MSDTPDASLAIGAEEALTHDDPVVRIVARGSLSGWVDLFQAWVNEEFSRSDDRLAVLYGISRLLVMTHSSLAANIMKEGGFPPAADALKALIDELYVNHAQQAYVAIRATRRAR